MQLMAAPERHAHAFKEGELWDLIQHMILPVATLAIGMLAYYLKFVRDGMMEVLDDGFLMTARAKGASERRVIYVHALKNALIPVITLIALDIPVLISGSAIVENVFNWPGLGTLMVTSALKRNFPVLIAIIMIVSGGCRFSQLGGGHAVYVGGSASAGDGQKKHGEIKEKPVWAAGRLAGPVFRSP
ncbi:ABC transporter permease [Paenibacillus sp. JTLBN-2024]